MRRRPHDGADRALRTFIPDADGNPRLVAGVVEAQFDESDGSHGEFQALYTGLGPSLLPPPGESQSP